MPFRIRPSVVAAVLILCPSFAWAGSPAVTRPAGEPGNRLAQEKSPYLLQHAHNPVDWYPWGEEAFARARKENKPIFLSVGYSTCHWCHVMERESFEDPAVAKLLNQWTVPIKVDREERPDVDRVYMTYVQASTGSGGWPMTVLLTPDLKPFFGGSYFPPEERGGLPGLKDILTKTHELWEKDHDNVVATADRIARTLRAATSGGSADPTGAAAGVSRALLAKGLAEVGGEYDAAHGGFGSAPKFPQPAWLNFLLHESRDPALDAADRDKARAMALRTLRAMADGGIHDPLGGGFHRYSTDARWFLPHFEKMLYDQAQLAGAYLDAYQATGEAFYAGVARDVLDYVLRDLIGPGGEFYSAEDADSAADPARPREKGEGAFYAWTAAEIDKVLGPARNGAGTAPANEAARGVTSTAGTADGSDAAVFDFHYGVKAAGNVAFDPRREFVGTNVLFVAHAVDETARQFGKPPAEIETILSAARRKLFAAREARPRPHRDDKTLAAWNGLMISALARGGAVLGEPRYADAAVKAANFIRQNLYDPKTRGLTRRWRDGRADVAGFLDDYAFVVAGLLDLYESTLDVQWLRLALDLQTRQDELFGDAGGDGRPRGYFTTAAADRGGDANIFLRLQDDSDGAEPAANSVAAMNLLRLAQMTGDARLAAEADGCVGFYAARLAAHPASMPQMLAAFDYKLSKPRQIVLAGKPGAADTTALLREVNSHYLPNRIVLCADGAAGQTFLGEKLAFIKDVAPIDGKATAYVCENYACQLPTHDAGAVGKLLARDAGGATTRAARE